MFKPQYKTFLDVCDCGSFSKAAEKMYISPSAVIQQINILEKELDAKLFTRTPRGVTLTAEGVYLSEQVRSMMSQWDKTMSELDRMKNKKGSITVASSLIEKCRLLYDLWMLFSSDPDRMDRYEIRMLTVSTDRVIPPGTELMESINSEVDWMKEWNFLKITEVPFALATGPFSPLHGRDRIELCDLKGVDVMTLNRGTSEPVTQTLQLLEEAGANILYYNEPVSQSLFEASFRKYILLIPACWKDILVNMKVHPFAGAASLPYGIFYRSEISEAARDFLEFIRRTYSDENESGVVPYF